MTRLRLLAAALAGDWQAGFPRRTTVENYPISIADLKWAEKKYIELETREFLYRAAIELVELTMLDKSKLNTGEALAVLLLTWNRTYYRFRPFTREHVGDLDLLCQNHKPALTNFRRRSIVGFVEKDEKAVAEVFDSFAHLLGPVGAAKALHLLAPNFFPLWDRAIADKYGVTLWPGRSHADRYCQFMRIAKGQVKAVGGKNAIGRNALKAIDEFNYCTYTLGLTR